MTEWEDAFGLRDVTEEARKYHGSHAEKPSNGVCGLYERCSGSLTWGSTIEFGLSIKSGCDLKSNKTERKESLTIVKIRANIFGRGG